MRNPTANQVYWFVIQWDPVDHWHIVARHNTYKAGKAEVWERRKSLDNPYDHCRMLQGRARAEPYMVRGCPTCEDLMELPGRPWKRPWPLPLPICAACGLPILARVLTHVEGAPMHTLCARRIQRIGLSNKEQDA